MNLTTPKALEHVRVEFTRTWDAPSELARTEFGVLGECAPEAARGAAFEVARTPSGLSVLDGGFGLHPPNVISLSMTWATAPAAT